MKKALVVLAALAMVASASAAVRVFVTSSADGFGLTNPANAFTPTFSTVDAAGNNTNAYDYYMGTGPFVVAAFPAIDAPSGTEMAPVEIQPGDFAYIWLQFVDEAKNVKINGLEVTISGEVLPTWYVQNDIGGNPSKKRWDGTATPPGYPEWHNNPQTMVAVTAAGIVNSLDDPQMMFDNQVAATLRTGVALLGAIENNASGVHSIAITDINYASGTPGALVGGWFNFVPEPASLVLLGLAGLMIRRR